MDIIGPDIGSAYSDGTLRCIVQPRDQRHQRRFAAAGGADDAKGRPCGDAQRNIMQTFLRAISLIAESHMIKDDLPAFNRHNRGIRIFQRRFFVQQFRNTFGGGSGHIDHNQHHGKHHQAVQCAHGIGDHAGQFACGQLRRSAQHDHTCAEPADQKHAGVNCKLHQRHIPCNDTFCFSEDLIDFFGYLSEFFVFIILPHEAFDHTDSGKVFLYVAVQFIIDPEHAFKAGVRKMNDQVKPHAQNRDSNQIVQ